MFCFVKAAQTFLREDGTLKKREGVLLEKTFGCYSVAEKVLNSYIFWLAPVLEQILLGNLSDDASGNAHHHTAVRNVSRHDRPRRDECFFA